MATIITRAGKASALSANEYDENLKQETNAQASNYTVVTGDNRATVEYTGSGSESITLPDASTLLAAEDTGDFEVTIKHGGTGTLTVAFNTGDTADGVDADITLMPNDCITLKAGSVTDDWMVTNVYRVQPIGALAYRSTDASVANATWEGVAFNTETYDYASCLSNPSGTTIITVPAWCTQMRVECQIGWDVDSTGDRLARLYTGSTGGAGSALSPSCQMRHSANNAASGTGGIYYMASGWRTVSPGATYHIDAFHSKSSGALNILADLSWLFVEFK